MEVVLEPLDGDEAGHDIAPALDAPVVDSSPPVETTVTTSAIYCSPRVGNQSQKSLGDLPIAAHASLIILSRSIPLQSRATASANSG